MAMNEVWKSILRIRLTGTVEDDLLKAILLKYVDKCFTYQDANKKRRNKKMQQAFDEICRMCKRNADEIKLF